jgi:hypothetical protein
MIKGWGRMADSSALNGDSIFFVFSGLQGFRRSDVQGFRSSRLHGFRDSGVQGFGASGKTIIECT